MNGWVILALVAVVLILLGQLRLGVAAEYAQTGAEIRLRLGALQFKVFPLEKKEKTQKQLEKERLKQEKAKAKKEAKKAKKAQEPQKPLTEKAGGALDLAGELLPVVLECAGCFWNKLVVDELRLRLTVGASDPADAALLYGQANAALAALWQPLTQAFHVKDGHANITVDFEAQSMTVYAGASLSVKLGQLIWLGLCFGVKGLAGFLRYRNTRKNKEQARKAV